MRLFTFILTLVGARLSTTLTTALLQAFFVLGRAPTTAVPIFFAVISPAWEIAATAFLLLRQTIRWFAPAGFTLPVSW